MCGLSVISNDLADPKQRTKNEHLVFVVVIYVCALALQGLFDMMGWGTINHGTWITQFR
jgi:hypothetical protein